MYCRLESKKTLKDYSHSAAVVSLASSVVFYFYVLIKKTFFSTATIYRKIHKMYMKDNEMSTRMDFSLNGLISREEQDVTSSLILKEKMRTAWIGAKGRSLEPVLQFLNKQAAPNLNVVHLMSRGKLMDYHMSILVSSEER